MTLYPRPKYICILTYEELSWGDEMQFMEKDGTVSEDDEYRACDECTHPMAYHDDDGCFYDHECQCSFKVATH